MIKKIIRGVRNPVKAVNLILRKTGIRYQIPYLSHIVLYINSICNARCIMCDVGQRNKRGIDAMVYGNRDMPLNMLKKILQDDYVRKRKMTFNITMTEPLLTPSIADYIQEIKKRGHEVNVTTNGYLLPEKAQELVDSNLDSIQISLDGPAKINDWIRGKKGFFERAIRGIKKVEGKVPIRINYTVSNLNYQYLEEFTEAIDKKVKIDLVKFQFLDFVSEEMSKKQERYAFKQTVSSVDKNTDPQKVDAAILKEQIQRIKNRKYKNIGKIAFIPNLSKREEIEAYFNNEGKPLKNHSACRWPFNQIAINTNGDVFFHMRCFNYNIGNVNKESISKIFNGEKARFFRGEFRKAGMCFPACTRCCGVMFC